MNCLLICDLCFFCNNYLFFLQIWYIHIRQALVVMGHGMPEIVDWIGKKDSVIDSRLYSGSRDVLTRILGFYLWNIKSSDRASIEKISVHRLLKILGGVDLWYYAAYELYYLMIGSRAIFSPAFVFLSLFFLSKRRIICVTLGARSIKSILIPFIQF